MLAWLVAARRGWNAERSVWGMGAAPASSLEQPLEVLSGGNQQSLAVDSPQTAQPKASHPMPLFAFSEERLDPDLALAHRLLVRGR